MRYFDRFSTRSSFEDHASAVEVHLTEFWQMISIMEVRRKSHWLVPLLRETVGKMCYEEDYLI
jgi:hypothetical protein